ncbi:MAG: DUF3006 domain-containing protein [Dethiobacteria bacterium]|jgi:hypothetical protein
MKVVIDRFEGDYAVLLVGEKELKVNMPRELLPEGIGVGSWLKMSFKPDPAGEKKQREKIEGLLERLKKRNE